MRVLVCGGRDWDDEEIIWTFLEGFASYAECHNMDDAEPLVIIEGQCPYGGADKAAEDWAKDARCGCGCKVGHLPFPAHPEQYPFRMRWKAFHDRNQRMLDEGKPEVMLAFKDGFDHTLSGVGRRTW